MRYLIPFIISIGSLAAAGSTALFIGELDGNGVTLHFEVRIEPAGSGSPILGSGSFRDGEVTKQFFYDAASREYFGYDLRMAVTGNGRCQLTVRALSMTAEDVARESHARFPKSAKSVEIEGLGTYEGSEGDEITFRLRRFPNSRKALIQKTLLQRCTASR